MTTANVNIPRTPARSAQSNAAARRFFVRLIIVTSLIPLSFEIGGVRLTPSLLTLIALFPMLIFRFFSGAVPWRLPDLLFFLFIAWSGLSILINTPSRFVVFTGQQGLLTLTAYLAGRLLVRDKEDFYAMVGFWALAAIFTLPFAVYEVLTDKAIIMEFIRNSTPFDTFNPIDYPPRLGLYRAQVVFTHPIHYGLMSAIIISTFFIGFQNRISNSMRLLGTALVGAACFMSVSSGAILSIGLQMIMYVWYGLASLTRNAWRTVLISGAIIYTILEVLSTKSAFVALSSRLAFNSHNAYYRTLIWQHGTAQVRRTPIFGIGDSAWERPSWMLTTVDNYWLVIAMKSGLPALALLVASVIYAFIMVNRNIRKDQNPEVDRLRVAWTIALIGFCMSASTVHIWGEIQLLSMLFFGAGFWMIAPQSPAEASEEPPEQQRQQTFTRFPSGDTGSAAPVSSRSVRKSP